MRIILATVLGLCAAFNGFSQEPNGYYYSAEGLSGNALKVALHDIIKGHSVESYSDLWDDYYTTDRKANGKIWDMYSDIPGGTPPYQFSYGTDQCGNYNSEGDCYNREHSWPKSHFNDQAPMRSDLFIVIPTDGYVNSKRSNYPYGKVSNPTWTSQNGSKLGQNTYANSGGGVCFEPIDAYKGDMARSYFYVATRYYGEDNSWDTWEMAIGAELRPWAVSMLLEWHHNDPVSDKEIARNNAVYAIQHNRNPFIDHPEFVDCIWAGSTACSNSTGVSDVEDLERNINIFPNPANTELNILFNKVNIENATTVTLINILGQTMQEQHFNNTPELVRINTSTFAAGMYYLKIQNSNQIATSKIQINH